MSGSCRDPVLNIIMTEKKSKHSNSDEGTLFRDAVGEVTPVRSRRIHHEKRAKPAKARFRRADETAVLHESLEDPQLRPVESGEHLLFQRPQVSKQIMRKLRRGQYAIQEEIDLHGMTADEAKAALREFIHACGLEKLGCVRIVHGKGLRSGPDGPVLKALVNSWLPNRQEVLAFCSAPQNDGGTGAVYVLLREP